MLNGRIVNLSESTDLLDVFLKNIKLLSFDETFNAFPMKYPSWEMQAVEGLVIKCGVPVNITDKNGATLLMWASENGHADIVQFLLNCGADPELRDHQGQTALIKAAIKWHPSIVARFIATKVDTEIPDHLGKSALTYALSAESNEPTNEIAMLLLKHQQKLNQTQNQMQAGRFAREFVLGVENYHIEAVDFMLKHKPSLLTPHEDFLYKVVAKNDERLVSIFLQRSSLALREKLFAFSDKAGKTALELALQRGHLPCIRRLLAAGDNILKLKNPDDQKLLRAKLANKHWVNVLKAYVNNITAPQNTPTLTLTELSAEIVSEQAEQNKILLNKILPEELVILCQKAPAQLMLRTHNKILQQKKAFVENEFAAYETQMREKPVAKKRRLR